MEPRQEELNEWGKVVVACGVSLLILIVPAQRPTTVSSGSAWTLGSSATIRTPPAETSRWANLQQRYTPLTRQSQ